MASSASAGRAESGPSALVDSVAGAEADDMTTDATHLLRATHDALRPGIDAVRRAADAVGRAPTDEVDRLVDAVCTFFLDELIPHAVAEDRVLYPAIDRILGAVGASWPMRRDHVELGHLVDRLRALRHHGRDGGEHDRVELSRVLYALDSLVRLHLAKEEELYLPLLDERADEPWVAALADVMAAVVESERTAHAPA